MSGLVYTHTSDTRRISTRSEQLRTNGSDTIIGTDPNSLKITQNGRFSLRGEAVSWDEISTPLIGRNVFITAGRIDYDYTNLTIDFSTTARYPEDFIAAVIQLKHSRLADSDIRPHIHWFMYEDATPNILIEYRWINHGEVPTAWVLKALLPEDNVFPYTPGMQQATNFNLPDGHGIGKYLSSTFECKVYRDTGNISGLFPGVDTYTSSFDVKYYDIHFQKAYFGSAQEFVA